MEKLTNANNIPIFGMEADSADRVICARGDRSARGDHLHKYFCGTLCTHAFEYFNISCQGLKIGFEVSYKEVVKATVLGELGPTVRP